jgi:hypothetical protein
MAIVLITGAGRDAGRLDHTADDICDTQAYDQQARAELWRRSLALVGRD